jgi:hypothetical protein
MPLAVMVTTQSNLKSLLQSIKDKLAHTFPSIDEDYPRETTGDILLRVEYIYHAKNHDEIKRQKILQSVDKQLSAYLSTGIATTEFSYVGRLFLQRLLRKIGHEMIETGVGTSSDDPWGGKYY